MSERFCFRLMWRHAAWIYHRFNTSFTITCRRLQRWRGLVDCIFGVHHLADIRTPLRSHSACQGKRYVDHADRQSRHALLQTHYQQSQSLYVRFSPASTCCRNGPVDKSARTQELFWSQYFLCDRRGQLCKSNMRGFASTDAILYRWSLIVPHPTLSPITCPSD